MKIKITDTFIFFSYDNQQQKQLINPHFIFEDKSKVFAGGKFDATKIKKVRFIETKKQLSWLRTGFLKEFLLYLKHYNINVEKIEDERTKLPHQKKEYTQKYLEKYFPFDYNDHQTASLKKLLKSNRGIVKFPTASGKCFAKGTEIIMYNGDIKKVEDIKNGDYVLGIDSKPKKVYGFTYGFDKLYKIKSKFDSYIVNKDHILSLKITNIGDEKVYDFNRKYYKSGEVCNISIEDYFSSSKNFKHVAKVWKKEADFNKKELLLNPYFLGVWLGDGSSNRPAITTMDEEVKNYLYEYSQNFNLLISIDDKKNNKSKTYYLTTGTKKGPHGRNKILNSLRYYNLINNKHIPFDYKINSKENRLMLLAGLIDTDGYVDNKSSYFEIIQKNKQLIEDIKFVCDSLGFYSKIKKKNVKGYKESFYRLAVYGNGIEKIPTRVNRKKVQKRKQKKNPLVSGFEIEYIGEGEYFGFQIEDENKLFFLKDFQVVHNSDILISYLKETNEPAIILVDRVLLANQLSERAKESGLEDVGILHGKKNDTENKKFVFCTIGSIKKLSNIHYFNALIVDEIHHASSKRFQDFLSQASFPVQIGFSATPNKGDDYLYALIRQFFGDILYEAPAETMIENEVIAKPEIIFVENEVNPMIDWPSSYKECIIKNHERNKIITDIVEAYNEKILILIKDVKNKQGEILKKYIQENTMKNVEFIHGNSNEREEVLDWFENGDLDVLISTNILNEGVSLKEIRVLVNASGGKSKVENLQKIGRGTRIKKDKKKVIVYDFSDIGNKFTQKHSKKRRELYTKEGFTDIKTISPSEI